MSQNPYEGLPPGRFWRTGVADASPLGLKGLYEKKWAIKPSDKIAAAGSCFAQHISRFLRAEGYSVIDQERAPMGLLAEQHQTYGFSMYSARYGNIYTVRQLLQLAQEAISGQARTDIVWEKEGRFYDALRPNVEPHGHATPEDVIAHRQIHIVKVARMLLDMNVFVFTLGLTEAWENTQSGLIYPTAPGTLAGEFDDTIHAFRNFTAHEVRKDMMEFISAVRAYRERQFRLLLTVSPVPLTATASGRHILQASIYSKSVLRGVAGQLGMAQNYIDYFPSYEIITNPASRGVFFAPNLRSVTPEGVQTVMKVFFDQHSLPKAKSQDSGAAQPAASGEDEVQCEEALLEAFAK